MLVVALMLMINDIDEPERCMLRIPENLNYS